MLKVVGHRVLVKVLQLEEVDDAFASAKRSGLDLSAVKTKDAEQKAVDRGIVVQIGNTAYKDFGGEPWCEVGEEVIFSRYAGKIVKDPYTEEEFTCLNDEDVLIVIKKEG